MRGAKINAVIDELSNGLKSGSFGASGEYFLTAREITERYSISLDSACKVLSGLQSLRLVRLEGKHYYITTGYAPQRSLLGEYLQKSRRRIFGMVLNNIESPFFASLAKELGSAADRAGYKLLIYSAHKDYELEAEIIDQFIELGASGIFTCPGMAAELDDIYSFCPLPVVSLGRNIGVSNCDNVLVDNYSAGAQVASHLCEIGCTKFAYVGLDQFLAKDPRMHGFADQLRTFGFELEKNSVIAVPSGVFAEVDVISGMLGNILKERRSERLGIFCYHDLLASEVLKYLKNHRYGSENLSIPEDVAIVGFDDLPIASSLTPPLTTVSYRYASIAQMSVDIMLDYVNNADHKVGVYEIPSSLNVRASTVLTES